MKRKLLSKVTLLAAISLFALETNAQDADKNVKQKIVDQNGKPSFIEFNENSSYRSNDSQKTFKEQLGVDNNSSFKIPVTWKVDRVVRRALQDPLSRDYSKMKYRYNQVCVLQKLKDENRDYSFYRSF